MKPCKRLSCAVLGVFVATLSLFANPSHPKQPEANAEIFETVDYKFRLDVVADDLDTPWSIAFLPDGRMLVTERPGRLRLINADGTLEEKPIGGVPEVRAHGSGGLLEVALHPNYEENGWIYFTFAKKGPDPQGKEGGFTWLSRGRLKGHEIVDYQILWSSPEQLYVRDGRHYGGRIVFDREGFLYFSIGDRGTMEYAQDLTKPNGMIMRLHDDGRIPEDNPFYGKEGAVQSAWSFGHRNPQGLDLDPWTGQIWSTEHGPFGGDELNLIQGGKNYGWPITTWGQNYDGSTLAPREKEGVENPVLHWTPSIAVCGIDFYEGGQFARWKGDLLVAALASESLRRLQIRDGRVIYQELIMQDQGRVRDVACSPKGQIYVLLNTPNRVSKLTLLEDKAAVLDAMKADGKKLKKNKVYDIAAAKKAERAAAKEKARALSGLDNSGHPKPALSAAAMFASNCASCHGSNMQGGGLGTSLVDGSWAFATDDDKMAHVIRNGIPNTAMPSMAAKLSDENVRDLVKYIRDQEAKARAN